MVVVAAVLSVSVSCLVLIVEFVCASTLLLLSSLLSTPPSLLSSSPSVVRKWECTVDKYARMILSRSSMVSVAESKDCFSSGDKPHPGVETANGHLGAVMAGLSWPTEDDTLITRPCGRKSGRSESHTRRVPK